MSEPVFIKDKDLPVIVGTCHLCDNKGDRNLVMIEFINNKRTSGQSIIRCKCIVCLGEFEEFLKNMANKDT
jgi:hypothetical protein